MNKQLACGTIIIDFFFLSFEACMSVHLNPARVSGKDNWSHCYVLFLKIVCQTAVIGR